MRTWGCNQWIEYDRNMKISNWIWSNGLIWDLDSMNSIFLAGLKYNAMGNDPHIDHTPWWSWICCDFAVKSSSNTIISQFQNRWIMSHANMENMDAVRVWFLKTQTCKSPGRQSYTLRSKTRIQPAPFQQKSEEICNVYPPAIKHSNNQNHDKDIRVARWFSVKIVFKPGMLDYQKAISTRQFAFFPRCRGELCPTFC